MDAATWRKAKDLLAAVLTRPAEDRDAFLARACDDPALRHEVGQLLKHSDSVGSLDALAMSSDEPFDDVPELQAGTRIGPYVIVERLGVGGMGAVFLGSDTRLRRRVALKCLLSHGTLPELRSKVMHEARAAARINHPNVAVVHDVVEHDGRVFIVMEYVEGESLAARIRRERLPLAASVSIARQLAAALTAAHGRGVIHRDLKPANIQVTPDGSVKVLDFGVAWAVSVLSTTSAETTTTGTAAGRGQPGTPPYMAPEQLLGETADERADIFSLGVVLYEMLCGRRPCAETEPGALLAAFAEPVLPPHDVDPSIPHALSDLVARALDPNPAARFQSAAELGSALESIERTTSASPGIAGSTKPWMRGRRAWIAATFLASLALVGAAVPVLVRRNASKVPPREPVVAVLPFDTGGDARLASLTRGLTEVPMANLTTLPGVVVVPGESTAKYTSTAALPAAAKELGFDYAIIGAVQGPDGGKRIVLSITNPSTGAGVATRGFAVAEAATLPLLEEAAQWVASEFQGLAQSQGAHPAVLPTSDMRAFEDYSQGRLFLDRQDVAGNPELAIAAFRRAIGRDQRFALAHAALGEACWAKYQHSHDSAYAEQAMEATLEALRLDPRQPMVRYALALVYQGIGRKQEAIDELHAAIATQPSSDTLHRELCRDYSDIAEHDKAIAECLVAIRLRPGFWGNYRALGIVYYYAGRYPDAIATFSRLTELQPDSATGFQLLGAAYELNGDVDRALANYQRANAISPSATAWANIGDIYARQRRFGDAVAAYRKSIQLHPREPATYRSLGDALARSGDKSGAAAAYRQGIAVCDARLAVEKGDATILSEKAVGLAKTGRFTNADVTIAAARVRLASGAVLYNAAVIEALEHRSDAALTSLRLAIEKGYSRALARWDEDLAPLRASPEFARIVSPR